jgi:hypothetical protein
MMIKLPLLKKEWANLHLLLNTMAQSNIEWKYLLDHAETTKGVTSELIRPKLH